LAGGLLAVLVSGHGTASQVADLTTFTPGTPARASEVNANFNALKEAVNDTDARECRGSRSRFGTVRQTESHHGDLPVGHGPDLDR